MFKLFAVILISAVCMSSVVEGSATARARSNDAVARATVSDVNTLNPAIIDYYGYQIGVPLLTPNVGPLTRLYSAALPPRSYVGRSNPVLIRGRYADQFIGESSIGMVAL